MTAPTTWSCPACGHRGFGRSCEECGQPRPRATSLTHPAYKLTADQRHTLGQLAVIGAWSVSELARTFGVSRKTVGMHRNAVLAGRRRLEASQAAVRAMSGVSGPGAGERASAGRLGGAA